MRIAVTSVMVDDQEKALRFYTEALGFTKKADVSAGDYRWLTVVAPEGTQEVELLLEPAAHPAALAYRKALYEDGIPATSFASSDIHAEFGRLSARGVVFRMKPTKMGPATIATFEDGCGNLIQLVQTE